MLGRPRASKRGRHQPPPGHPVRRLGARSQGPPHAEGGVVGPSGRTCAADRPGRASCRRGGGRCAPEGPSCRERPSAPAAARCRRKRRWRVSRQPPDGQGRHALLPGMFLVWAFTAALTRGRGGPMQAAWTRPPSRSSRRPPRARHRRGGGAVRPGRDTAGRQLPAAPCILANTTGRVVVSSIGKSGHVGRKIRRHPCLHRHAGAVRPPGRGLARRSRHGGAERFRSGAVQFR